MTGSAVPVLGPLVARVATGDESALAALYDALGARAYSLAHAILGDPGEAEEAVADTFLQVWTTARSFDASRGSVAAWVAMIVRSRSLDRLRSRRRRAAAVETAASFDTEGAAVPLSNPGTAPDVSAQRVEMRARVAQELSQLPESQRVALEMAFFRGLSHSEIAAELDEPLGTVKTRIRAAMEKLRQALATYVEVG